MRAFSRVSFWLVMLGLVTSAAAAAPDTSPDALESQLHYQSGDIVVGANLATLHLGKRYRFLSPADAQRVLTEGWGNPPGTETLGMIVPATVSPLSPVGWGVVITYIDDGHVADDDAAKIDYNDLLKELRSGEAEENKERRKEGYEGMHLTGWAKSPHYDPSTKLLYWAKEFEVDGNRSHTLNYDVRLLGRTGVLSFNAVAGMGDLPRIDSEMTALMPNVAFNPGNRYDEFRAGTDKLAAYGLGALVAGSFAAKAGLFKGLLLGLLAFKKFLILGVIALIAGAKKILGSLLAKKS